MRGTLRASAAIVVTLGTCAAGIALGAGQPGPSAAAQPRPPTKRAVPRPRACPAPRVASAPWLDADRAEDHYDDRARHVAFDVIVNPGADAELRGKFAYGRSSHDMEAEWVVALLRTRACGPWLEVGRARTDGDGRATIRAPGVRLAAPGRHEFAFVVPADGSFALGSVWALRRGAEVVVFDIDGTLTTGDDEVIAELTVGSEPEMYEGANDLARAWASSGRQPVYVTGRPYFLQDSSRRWLEAHGFPPGPVRTTDQMSDSLTNREHVGRFKRDYLRDLLAPTGVVVAAAYGNALTDVCAYAEAGIPQARTFIIGQYAGAACDRSPVTQGVRTYPTHLVWAREHLLGRPRPTPAGPGRSTSR